jgi:retron-type reverse transcriptase
VRKQDSLKLGCSIAALIGIVVVIGKIAHVAYTAYSAATDPNHPGHNWKWLVYIVAVIAGLFFADWWKARGNRTTRIAQRATAKQRKPRVRKRSVPWLLTADVPRLEAHGVPILRTPEELAAYLKLDIKQLRWLANVFRQARHYRRWELKKRRGGTRTISSPLGHLRRAQRVILRDILQKVPASNAAHAYEKQRSVVTNALPHARQQIVINLDLVGFFDAITYRRVRGVFSSMGYSRDVSWYIALLCTAAPDLDPKRYDRTHRTVPQGAITSPALSNLVCRRLDKRLAGLARKFGANYTRYADDLTFSGGHDFDLRLRRFFILLYMILRREGFEVNWPKRRIRRKGARQMVTGIVVNDRPNLTRQERRQLRAMLHRKHTTGNFVPPPGVQNPDAWLTGKLAYYRMIAPPAADRLAKS